MTTKPSRFSETVFEERKVQIPDELTAKISTALQKWNISLQDISRISESILRLSDFYLSQPESPTPWRENWAQIAYLTYFLPLNWLRAQAVVREGQTLDFFNDLESFVDFGAGLGSGSMHLSLIKNQIFVETSTIAQNLHKSLLATSSSKQTWTSEAPRSLGQKTLSIFSYSLTELKQLPPWALQSEALMILEPGTRDDGRKLLQLRDQLIREGFSIWAPCTHQGLCPLLTQSKTDWCHDRIHFEAPDWFKKIEAGLPIKNSTLTTSYLLARRAPSAKLLNDSARTVGDQVIEKGKTRQLVCRGPEREFLTWMDRDWKKGAPRVPRGVFIEKLIDGVDTEKKSNELRVRSTAIFT